MASGARKALNRNTSAAAGDSSCTASKLAAQVRDHRLGGIFPGPERRASSELQASAAIALEIASKRQPMACGDVGRRLLQGERQSVQLAGELSRRRLVPRPRRPRGRNV